MYEYCRTIANMTMIMPDGREFDYSFDFGYAYPIDAAEYMFLKGNYACDCNRSMFLAQAGHDVIEMNCGDEISLRNFRVAQD